jgi:hypothetical protein
MVLLPRSTPAIRKNKPSPKLRNNSAALVLQVVLNRSCPNPRPIGPTFAFCAPRSMREINRLPRSIVLTQAGDPKALLTALMRPHFVDKMRRSTFAVRCTLMDCLRVFAGGRAREAPFFSHRNEVTEFGFASLFGASQIAGKIFFWPRAGVRIEISAGIQGLKTTRSEATPI